MVIDPTRFVAPPIEPVSLAEVKLNDRIDHSALDTLITTFIQAARFEIEHLLRRTLINTTWEQLFSDFKQATACLWMAPVTGLVSVEYRDSLGVWLPVDVALFELRNENEPARITPVGAWPSIPAGSLVRVRYTAGFGATAAAVPAQLRHWIMLRVSRSIEGVDADDLRDSPLLWEHRIHILA